jgi:hypothetical protein
MHLLQLKMGGRRHSRHPLAPSQEAKQTFQIYDAVELGGSLSKVPVAYAVMFELQKIGKKRPDDWPSLR